MAIQSRRTSRQRRLQLFRPSKLLENRCASRIQLTSKTWSCALCQRSMRHHFSTDLPTYLKSPAPTTPSTILNFQTSREHGKIGCLALNSSINGHAEQEPVDLRVTKVSRPGAYSALQRRQPPSFRIPLLTLPALDFSRQASAPMPTTNVHLRFIECSARRAQVAAFLIADRYLSDFPPFSTFCCQLPTILRSRSSKQTRHETPCRRTRKSSCSFCKALRDCGEVMLI